MMSLVRLFLAQGWPLTFACAAAQGDRVADLELPGLTTATIDLNDTSFDHFIDEQRPDIVLFDRFMTEEQFGWRVERQCPAALRILETVDLHCLREARRIALTKGRKPTQLDLSGDLAKREIAAI